MALATQLSVLICPPTIARVIILSFWNTATFVSSFILNKRLPTQLPLSSMPCFKTWLRLMWAETFYTTTQTTMTTIQLILVPRKDIYAWVFQGVYPSGVPQVFFHTQPCFSLDLTGLHFISPRKKKENYSALTGCLQTVILERQVVFWTIILAAGSLTQWRYKAWREKCVVIACILPYFAVLILVWTVLYIIFLKINPEMISLLNTLSKNISLQFSKKCYTRVNKQGVKAQHQVY